MDDHLLAVILITAVSLVFFTAGMVVWRDADGWLDRVLAALVFVEIPIVWASLFAAAHWFI